MVPFMRFYEFRSLSLIPHTLHGLVKAHRDKTKKSNNDGRLYITLYMIVYMMYDMNDSSVSCCVCIHTYIS